MKEFTFRKAIFYKSYYDVIDLFNERTKESFRFNTGAVSVKQPCSEIKKMKSMINELFNKTDMDWTGYFNDILFFTIPFIFLYIEFYFFIFMLT